MSTAPTSVSWSDATTLCFSFDTELDPASVPSAEALYVHRAGVNYDISSISAAGNALYISLESEAARTLQRTSGEYWYCYTANASGKRLADVDGNEIGSFIERLPLDSIDTQLATSDVFLSRTLLSGDAAAVDNILGDICSRHVCVTTSSTATLTLTVDNGVFRSSTAYGNVSSDGTTLTLSGTQDEIYTALDAITVDITAGVQACADAGKRLASTISLSLEDETGISSDSLRIFVENVDAASFFALDARQYAYVNSVDGLSSSSFTEYEYADAGVIDAEKSPNRSNDDDLCWAATAANMLTWTGYGDALSTDKSPSEDEVFATFWQNFSDNGSTASYGISWFMTGLYDAPASWAQPVSGSGNYVGTMPHAYQALDVYVKDTAAPYVDDLAAAIFAGDGAGLAVTDIYNSGHAITCWGLSFDVSRAQTDPQWLTGVYITDSDDEKNTTSPANTLRYVPLTWDATQKAYELIDYDEDAYYWDGSFNTLARADSLKEQLTHTLATHNNPSDASVVVSGQISVDALCSSGGQQTISSGGLAIAARIDVGGSQIVDAGGTAQESVFSGGTGIVRQGGIVSAAQVSDGGVLYISRGGTAWNTTLASGGSQYVVQGGSALFDGVDNGGVQIVAGWAEESTVTAGGNVHVSKGGMTSAVTVEAGGTQTIFKGGKDVKAVIAGTQTVAAGGSAVSVRVNNGGVQTVAGYAQGTTISKGGKLQVNKGGVTSAVSVKTGATETIAKGGKDVKAVIAGAQTVAAGGSAYNVRVNNGGVQTVAGYAQGTTISKGGKLQVNKGGIASAASILTGGNVTVAKGGMARKATVANGGRITAKAGALVSSVTLKAGAKLSLAAGNTVAGKNTFTGATVSGGTTAKRVTLAKKATLSVGSNTNMKKLHLAANNASISVTGTGDTLGSLQTNKNTNISFDVSKVTAKSTATMLSLSKKSTLKQGSFSITVKKNQGVGTYELSKNIVQAKNTAYTVNQAGSKQGTAKLNGLGLIKGTAIYTVQAASLNISLTVAKTGKTSKGSAKADKLTGTANWDVFYGGKGNDTINGQGGQDVAVYDTSNWGKDVIAKTKGSMTILFNGIKKSDIVKKTKGSTVILTKKSDKKQSITIQGWSDKTHEIVYGSGMTAFNKYVKAAKPTTAQTTSARNEAFKKAGLASA